MKAGDFDPDLGLAHVRRSKSGKPRHIVLTDEGQTLFAAAAKCKCPGEPLFPRPDAQPWAKSQQHRFMQTASDKASIIPHVNFHLMRHGYASLLVTNGASLQVIAANLGHADTRMTERHYAHLSASYVAQVIREKLPRLDLGTTIEETAGELSL
jgi:site-specific recombinase XerD